MSFIGHRAPHSLRHLTIGVVAAALLTALPGVAMAEVVRFDIMAQPLPAAIQAFAIQAKMQLLYAYDEIARLRGNEVKGELEKHAALALLLRDTGLEASYSAENVATIRPVGTAASSRGPVTPIVPANKTLPGKTRASTSTDDDQASVLEEIIVTAQKRTERLRDVPVPVASLAAATLADKSQFRMQDYYAQVPGLALTPNEFGGAPSVAIRGITSGDATNPTVGIAVDDVQFGSSTSIGGGYFAPDFDPGDLARVEVLRGPQGTLYGAASIGGLIKYVTLDPSTDRLEGRVQAGIHGTDGGGRAGYGVSASANVPLGDAFALRVSGFTRQDPGYLDNIRAPGERDVNETRSAGGHVSALWRPSDQFSLKLSALIQQNRISGAPYFTVNEGLADLQQDFLPATGRLERQFEAFSATAVAEAGAIELTSVTAYSESHLDDSLDATGLFGEFTQEVAGTEDTLNTDDTTTYKFSQELRATARLGTNVELLVGAYYAREYSPYTLDIFAASPEGEPLDRMSRSRFFSTFREWAGFANLTYHFTDRFDLQVGGRRSEIKQSFGETDSGPFVPLLFGVDSPRTLLEKFAREHATTYLVTPRFKLTPDLMLYARLASGYRPGGINQGELSGLPSQFAPDETRNYEVGLKGSALGGRVLFDSSVYYIDWKDIQLSLINPANGQNYFTNGSRAKSQGVELSIQLAPVAGVRIEGWVVWNDAQLTEAMPTPEQGGVNGPKGARLPYGSRLSANASANYEFPLAGMTGVAGVSMSYVGERVGAFLADDSGRQTFPAYVNADVHAGLKNDAWTFDLFLNNVANRRGVLGGGNGTINPTAFQLIQPRTLGLSVARTF